MLKLLNIRKRLFLLGKIGKNISLYRALYSDKRTPLITKLLLGAAVAYIFFPLDFIPDFIPILGQLDELVIIPLLIYLALKFVPHEVYEEHRAHETSYKITS